MKCNICNSKKIVKRYSNFQGYIEGTCHDIFECLICNTQFIDTEGINEEIYKILYSEENKLLYDTKIDFLEEFKKQREPLNFLVKKEAIYSIIQNYVKGKSKLKILDVGCGDGYAVHGLNKLGHNAKGLDISKEAIKTAKKNFGNFFIAKDLESFKTKEKFDLIISIERVEARSERMGEDYGDFGPLFDGNANKEPHKNSHYVIDPNSDPFEL